MISIVAMAMITFFTRYLFLVKKLPFTITDKMQQFLSFSAPCILTAIWVPIVFIKDQALFIEPSNPYLIAASIAIILAYKFKNLYLTTIISCGVFFVLTF